MHDTDNLDDNNLLNLRWLKFNQDCDACPDCGLWHVYIKRMTNSTGANGTRINFWRWECRECGAVWFDPVRAIGSYWLKKK